MAKLNSSSLLHVAKRMRALRGEPKPEQEHRQQQHDERPSPAHHEPPAEPRPVEVAEPGQVATDRIGEEGSVLSSAEEAARLVEAVNVELKKLLGMRNRFRDEAGEEARGTGHLLNAGPGGKGLGLGLDLRKLKAKFRRGRGRLREKLRKLRERVRSRVRPGLRPRATPTGRLAKLAGVGRWAGRGLAALGVGMSMYDEYQDSHDKSRTLAVGAGSAAGMTAGAIAGQTIIPIPVVGALIGGAVGGYLGEKGARYLHDSLGGYERVEGSTGHDLTYKFRNILVKAPVIEFKGPVYSKEGAERIGGGNQIKTSLGTIQLTPGGALSSSKQERQQARRSTLTPRVSQQYDDEIRRQEYLANKLRESGDDEGARRAGARSMQLQREKDRVAGSTADYSRSGGVLGNIISRGEGGYGSYNRGTAGDSKDKIDFSQMTVGELMRRQALGKGDPDRIFAFGKYQVIPGTMKGAVEALGIDPNEKVTPELQERINREYLLDKKRPQIKDYITGKSDNLDAAHEALANEFASVPGVDGRGKYDGTAGNRANPAQAAAVREGLEAERRRFKELVDSGMSKEEAWRALSKPKDAPAAEPDHWGTTLPQPGDLAPGPVARSGTVDGLRFQSAKVQREAAMLSPDAKAAAQKLRMLQDYEITSTTGGQHAAGSEHYGHNHDDGMGRAIDVHTNSLTMQQRQELIENARRAGFNRVGISGSHLHLDMKPGPFTVFDEGGGAAATGMNAAEWEARLKKIEVDRALDARLQEQGIGAAVKAATDTKPTDLAPQADPTDKQTDDPTKTLGKPEKVTQQKDGTRNTDTQASNGGKPSAQKNRREDGEPDPISFARNQGTANDDGGDIG